MFDIRSGGWIRAAGLCLAQSTSYSIFYLEQGRAFLRLGTTYDPFQPDAQSLYALWNVTFDHSMSVAGPTQENLCGDADVAGCVYVHRGTWIKPDMSEWPFTGDEPIQWESEFGCLFCDPAQPTTWGVLKARYR